MSLSFSKELKKKGTIQEEMQFIYEDEVILFQTPHIENSIFVNRVLEEDKESIRLYLQQFGLIYRIIEKELYIQYWYYSSNAKIQCIERNGNEIHIRNHTYWINAMKPIIYDTKQKKFKPKPLRLMEMYNLCNYYIGFHRWCMKVNPFKLTFEGITLHEQPKKWCYRCSVNCEIIFPPYPNVLRGYSNITLKGKNDTDVQRRIIPLAITQAKKDAFKKLALVGIWINERIQWYPFILKEINRAREENLIETDDNKITNWNEENSEDEEIFELLDQIDQMEQEIKIEPLDENEIQDIIHVDENQDINQRNNQLDINHEEINIIDNDSIVM